MGTTGQWGRRPGAPLNPQVIFCLYYPSVIRVTQQERTFDGMATPPKINLDECSPQQLEELHQVFNQELQMMTSSLGTLNLALNKYRFSKEALTGMKVAQNESKSLPHAPDCFVLCVSPNYCSLS